MQEQSNLAPPTKKKEIPSKSRIACYQKEDSNPRTFASGCTNGDPIPRIEKIGLCDCVVNLGFKDVEETIPTDLLSGFWTL